MKEFEIVDGDKIEAVHVALLFNKGSKIVPEWVQLCNATENTIALNPELEDLKFIVDKYASTFIKGYKPSLNNPLTLIKGDEDYNYFWEKFYNLPTGKDANGDILVVFLNEKTGVATYKAWRCDCTFVMDTLDPANSQLTCTCNINGTTARGEVVITDGTPAFTEESGNDAFILTVTVNDGTAVSGATVIIGGTVKETDASGKATFTLEDGVKYTIGAYKGSKSYAEVFEADKDSASMSVTIA